MTAEEIQKFNSKVDYNESAISWIGDVICALIFWPTILLAVYRRCKYNQKIER